MGRVYFDEFGNPHGLPVGVESAKRYQTRTYVGDVCPVCEKRVRYTKNQKCILCARDNAVDLFGLAQGTMYFADFPEGAGEPGVSDTITMHAERHSALGRVGCRDVSFAYKKEAGDMLALVGEPAPMSIRAAVEAGKELWITSEPCGVRGHYGIRTLKNECYFCELKRSAPQPRREARKAGELWYVPTEKCDECGTLSKRNVHNNVCSGCKLSKAAKRSPRQAAIAAGKTWYVPTTPCPKCDTLSERNVHNGVCRGCKLPNTRTHDDQRQSPDSILMKAQPDLIMSRADAKELSMKVYRTGKVCHKGHTGFRYVSTNNCIDCMRGK